MNFDPALLDELARVYARAAVDALLAAEASHNPKLDDSRASGGRVVSAAGAIQESRDATY